MERKRNGGEGEEGRGKKGCETRTYIQTQRGREKEETEKKTVTYKQKDTERGRGGVTRKNLGDEGLEGRWGMRD